MKKFFASTLGIFLLATPAFALADTTIQMQIRQLVTVAAALEAQEAALASGQSLACAALASSPKVQVDEPFVLAWGSVGAANPDSEPDVSMWTPNGSSEVSLAQPGLWTYYFTFYSANEASTTCSAQVEVTPAQ